MSEVEMYLTEGKCVEPSECSECMGVIYGLHVHCEKFNEKGKYVSMKVYCSEGCAIKGMEKINVGTA